MSGRLPGSRSPPHPNTHDDPAVPVRPAAGTAASDAAEGVGGVGVVDEHRERLAGVDALEPPGHDQRVAETGDDRVEPEPGGPGGGRRGERVGEVERTRPAGGRRRAETATGGRRSWPVSPVAPNTTSVGADVGRSASSTAYVHTSMPSRGARVASSTPRASSTLTAAGRRARAREQRRLRLEVLVERAVVVEVLVAQVREAHGRELHAVDAVLVQRVRRHLHRDRARARVAHAREQGLQVAGLRRRVRSTGTRGIDALRSARPRPAAPTVPTHAPARSPDGAARSPRAGRWWSSCRWCR